MVGTRTIFINLALLACLCFLAACGSTSEPVQQSVPTTTDAAAKPAKSHIPTIDRTKIKLDLIALKQAVEMFHTIHEKFPADLQAVVKAELLTQAQLNNPWGHPYQFELKDGIVVIRCLGSDGQPGGTGDAADVSSQDS